MRLLLPTLLLFVFPPLLVAEDWAAWRGPLGTGVAPDQDVPTAWDGQNAKNIAWTTPLADEGNSTPLVVGGLVLITHADPDAKTRSLSAYARETGEQQWTASVSDAADQPTHKTNPYAASSPATDGKHVFCWFGSAGLHAFDLQGETLWSTDLGKFDHIWGTASTPVVHENLVIVHAGPGARVFLAAYNKMSGKEVWKREELETSVGEKRGSFDGAAWSTPLLFEQEGRTLMLLNAPYELLCLDPNTGDLLWRCRGLMNLQYTSPALGDGLVVAMSGYGGSAMGVRLPKLSEIPASKDITESHRLWRNTEKIQQRIGTGIIVEGHLYQLQATGIMLCINAETGERLWQQRLAPSWSSLVFVNGLLYAVTDKGKTFVIKPSSERCDVIAENSLKPQTIRSSPAFSDGDIFLRTYENLYCISNSD